MTRRSRLSKNPKSRKKNRLVSADVLTNAEESVVQDSPSEDMLSMAEESVVPSDLVPKKEIDELSSDSKFAKLSNVLSSIKKDVTAEYEGMSGKKEKLGGFLHEMIYLESPEDVQLGKNREVVKRLMSQHPRENVLVKVELYDEPSPDAGVHGMVRAEDLQNFEHVEISTPEGDVYTVPVKDVKEIIGVAPQSASISLPRSAETLGTVGAPVGFDAPVEVIEKSESESHNDDEKGV